MPASPPRSPPGGSAIGETGLLISYWAGTLAALLYAAVGARRCLGPLQLSRWRFAPAGLAPMLRECAPATVNDVLNGLFYRVDLYLVGILLGEGPAGIYGMARQIRTPIRQVRQSFDGLLNPIIARTLSLKRPSRNRRRYRLGGAADPRGAAADR